MWVFFSCVQGLFSHQQADCASSFTSWEQSLELPMWLLDAARHAQQVLATHAGC